MSKIAHPEVITEIELAAVTGGRFLFGGAQGGAWQPGLFPRLRQAAQGTFMQHRRAGLGGGNCPGGQCG